MNEENIVVIENENILVVNPFSQQKGFFFCEYLHKKIINEEIQEIKIKLKHFLDKTNKYDFIKFLNTICGINLFKNTFFPRIEVLDSKDNIKIVQNIIKRMKLKEYNLSYTDPKDKENTFIFEASFEKTKEIFVNEEQIEKMIDELI